MEDPQAKPAPDLRTEILADHREIAETLRLIQDNDPIRLPGCVESRLLVEALSTDED